MKWIAGIAAVFLAASLSYADSGVLTPGTDMRFGNVHVANLPGAGGNVNYVDNGRRLILVVHAEAVCAALKTNGDRQDREILALVLGDGYYAQGNLSGSYIGVIGDNAVALTLALRARHRNNGNTIELMGNGNIAAAVRWCYGRGEVLMNKIKFGVNAALTGSDNDAYVSGDREGTFDLLWANRSVDVAGTGNETIAFDGFPCPRPDDDDIEDTPADVARDVRDVRKDASPDAAAVDG